MNSKELVKNTMSRIAKRLDLVYYEYFDLNPDTCLKFRFEDQHGNLIDDIKVDFMTFNEDEANKIYSRLQNSRPINKPVNNIIGWRPISEYSREKYDWVLVKCFHKSFECIPEVAEMRVDGKWYAGTGALIDPDIFEVRYFFDMQQLDAKGEAK